MSNPISILLVASELDDQVEIIRQLEAWGYLVTHQSSYESALLQMMDEQPEILLIDQSVQDKSGLEFCAKVHQTGLSRNSHAIYLSDFAEVSELDSALSAGANDFIAKPFGLVELSARLKIASAKIAREQQLQSQAMTDPLTGLANRRNFYKQLDAERDRAIRYRHMVSYVTFDIDHFKTINDEYGHQAGDQLLMQIAAILKNNSRKSDIICRQGGDEFCALLPQTIEKDAASWVEKIRKKVSELIVEGKSGQRSISLSAGIVQIDQSSLSLAKMLDCADEALRVAKNMGRNRVIQFGQLGISADGTDLSHERSTNPMRTMLATDIMSGAFMSLKETQSIATAAQLLLQLRINSAPVVNDEGVLVGIVSEKDVLLGPMKENSWEAPLSSVMTKKVITYNEDTPAKVIHDFLCRSSIRRVIIVKDDIPVGVVSRGTALRWFGNWGELCDIFRENNLLDHSEIQSGVKDKLSEITNQLIGQIRNLDSPGDSEIETTRDLHCLVPVATRIQELSMDLLAISSYAPRFDSMRYSQPVTQPLGNLSSI
ncbi:MAG: hypothetical protein COA78_04730 [Blastopirellula sp.]|nr:MAG: hypothetical protein COA78_04730 [Blastopirellula sp.]